MDNNINVSSKKEDSEYVILCKDIGIRLRHVRLVLDYTQEEFAEMLNISTAYYGKIERGIHGLSLTKLVILYEKLDIDLTYLLTGKTSLGQRIDEAIASCPEGKKYDMSQLIKYAINLANDK